MKLQKRYDEAVGTVLEMRDLIKTEDRVFTADEESRWESLNGEIDSLKKQIEQEARDESLRAEQSQRMEDSARDLRNEGAIGEHASADDAEDLRTVALAGYLRGEHASDEQREAMRSVGYSSGRNIDVPLIRTTQELAEFRAMATGGTGATLIPVGFVNQLENALLAYSPMREVSDIIRTTSGNALHWPTSNDTGNTGALLAEGGTVLTQDPTFSEVVFNAYKYTSKDIVVSSEMLEDSAFNLATVLGQMIGERLGRIQNTQATTGTGTAQPNGIVTAATSVATAAASTMTADDIITLQDSVNRAYQTSAAFMMSTGIKTVVRKLKDTTGAYIWQPGLTAQSPDMLLGKPLYINDDMAAAVADAAVVMVYGQLDKYKIREVNNIRLRHKVEQYASTDQEAYVGFQRWDGDLLDAGTKPVKKLTVTSA